jgi:hypothetical protein
MISLRGRCAVVQPYTAQFAALGQHIPVELLITGPLWFTTCSVAVIMLFAGRSEIVFAVPGIGDKH